MEAKGAGMEGLSEQSKAALQSETWQEVRKAVKRRTVKHFTAGPDEGNEYGETWGKVVQEYLKTKYKDGDNSQDGCDIVVSGIKYQVLDRKQKNTTAFYDEAGDTLFDVSNERLAAEYEQLTMQDGKVPVPKGREAGDGAKPPDSQKLAGTAKAQAADKLKDELEKAVDKSFAEPVIGYLLKRCGEDEGLALDITQKHKTWKKCKEYLYDQARKQAAGDSGTYVKDDVVYEWAEDYYHKDDKAEEEKKAKKEAGRKAKQKEAAAKRKSTVKEKPAKATPTAEKKEGKEKEQARPKKSGKDIDGQLDMFSMMGM